MQYNGLLAMVLKTKKAARVLKYQRFMITAAWIFACLR
jgi:hypothetical protein